MLGTVAVGTTGRHAHNHDATDRQQLDLGDLQWCRGQPELDQPQPHPGGGALQDRYQRGERTNPSVFGQAVTFTATVVAAGAPVTAGTVTFRHGSQFLGSASLDSSGIATLSVSSLPAGKNQVQAVFVGTATNLSSVSPIWKQTVVAAPTVTTITLTTETEANGTTRYVLVATVTPGTAASTSPVTGTVVFRKKGSVIGRAKLKSGVAVLSIGRKRPRGKFVAELQRSSNFKASTSPPLVLPA